MANSTFVGFQAGYSGAGYSVMIGYTAGYSTTEASAGSVFIGYNAGGSNTTGVNTAVGQRALQTNTTGSSNAAFGFQSLYSNTTATGNTAVGYQAGYSNTTGSPIIAIGYQALYGNTTGADNVAVGKGTLATNTTGGANTAIGNLALLQNTTASYNTAVGYQAGYANTTSAGCTYVGYTAGSQTTGSNNTFLGSACGTSVTSGAKNTIIGGFTGNQGGLDIRTASNYIVLSDGDGNPRGYFDNNGAFFVSKVGYVSGNAAFLNVGADGTNQYGVTIANKSATNTSFVIFANSSGGVAGYISQSSATSVLYNVTSDYRLKNVISSVTDAGQRIDSLKPIEYEWKTGGKTKGFLAHQFAEIYPNSVSGEKDAVDKDGKPIYQGMQPSTPEVMADLIAEIQSLRKRVALLESK